MEPSVLYDYPLPYPDELVYSLLARRAAQLGVRDHRHVMKEAFGKTTLVAGIEFPTHLGVLRDRLPAGYPGRDQLVENHTLFRYYTAFAGGDRSERLSVAMRGSGGSEVWGLGGLISSRFAAPAWLRYCPDCLQADHEASRMPYWRRSHQLPWVSICCDHKMVLIESNVMRHPLARRYAFLCPDTLGMYSRRLTPRSPATITFAQLSRELLLCDFPKRDSTDLKLVYLKKMRDLGYIAGKTTIKAQQLIADFEVFCQQDLGIDDTPQWVIELPRGSRIAFSPVQHVALCTFLKISSSELFRKTEARVYVDPSLCDGVCCESHGTMLFVKEYYSPHIRSMVQVFSCPSCGRSDAVSRASQKRWIVDYGENWRQTLSRLWNNPKISLRQISRSLKVDAWTVKSHARKLNLSFPRKAARWTMECGIYIPRIKRQTSLQMLQEEWLSLVRVHASAGITKLRRLKPALYMKLYRRNPKWLRDSANTQSRICRTGRVDWAERDRALCQEYGDRLLSMKTENSNRRATATTLLNFCGSPSWARRNLHRLPQFRKTLDDLAESRVAFAVRKIESLGRKLFGKRLPRWNVYRLASIRKDLMAEAEVEEAVRTITS